MASLSWSLLLLLFLCTLFIFFSIHLIANYFFQYFFYHQFQLLTGPERRSCQHEFTSTMAVSWIFICFAIGASRLCSGIERSDHPSCHPSSSSSRLSSLCRRWTEEDYACYIGLLLTLGYTTYEELLYLNYGKELIYHLHHLLAALITIYACLYPKLHFFLCWGGTIEITGVFVNIFLIAKRFNFSSSVTNLLGGLMWLSFVIFRFISLVLMFVLIFCDSYYKPKQSIALISLPYLLVCGLSSAILFALSLFWLGKMTSRLLEIVLRSMKSKRSIHPTDSTSHQPLPSQPSLHRPVSGIPDENEDNNDGSAVRQSFQIGLAA
jgi:hypothetical protein